MREGSIL